MKNNWDALPARAVGSSFPCITLVEPFIHWLLLHRHRQVEHSILLTDDSLCALCPVLCALYCLVLIVSLHSTPLVPALTLTPFFSLLDPLYRLVFKATASPSVFSHLQCPPPPSLRHTLSRQTYLTFRVVQQNALVYKPRVGFCCAIAIQL